MSNIILARLHAVYGGGRVHSFDAGQDSHDGIRKAFCGFTAHYSALEPLPGLTGLGCELCIAEAPIATQQPPETCTPADDPASEQLYAVALRGEREWHRVAMPPVTSTYEYDTVALTTCGSIGILRHGDPPPEWSPCHTCAVL